MKGIKKSLFAVIFTAFAIVSINGAALAADGRITKVEIPFEFYVKNEKLAAGTYEIEKTGDTVFVLRSVETGKKILLATQTDLKNEDSKAEKIVFNQYGDRYFLRALYWNRQAAGRGLGESRTEKEIRQTAEDEQRLAGTAKPKTVSVSLER